MCEEKIEKITHTHTRRALCRELMARKKKYKTIMTKQTETPKQNYYCFTSSLCFFPVACSCGLFVHSFGIWPYIFYSHYFRLVTSLAITAGHDVVWCFSLGLCHMRQKWIITFNHTCFFRGFLYALRIASYHHAAIISSKGELWDDPTDFQIRKCNAQATQIVPSNKRFKDAVLCYFKSRVESNPARIALAQLGSA